MTRILLRHGASDAAPARRPAQVVDESASLSPALRLMVSEGVGSSPADVTPAPPAAYADVLSSPLSKPLLAAPAPARRVSTYTLSEVPATDGRAIAAGGKSREVAEVGAARTVEVAASALRIDRASPAQRHGSRPLISHADAVREHAIAELQARLNELSAQLARLLRGEELPHTKARANEEDGADAEVRWSDETGEADAEPVVDRAARNEPARPTPAREAPHTPHARALQSLDPTVTSTASAVSARRRFQRSVGVPTAPPPAPPSAWTSRRRALPLPAPPPSPPPPPPAAGAESQQEEDILQEDKMAHRTVPTPTPAELPEEREVALDPDAAEDDDEDVQDGAAGAKEALSASEDFEAGIDTDLIPAAEAEHGAKAEQMPMAGDEEASQRAEVGNKVPSQASPPPPIPPPPLPPHAAPTRQAVRAPARRRTIAATLSEATAGPARGSRRGGAATASPLPFS